ncbi:hypothetical protein [Leptolyngbya sp. FACHB-261]|uniref:hypothetical protein n=1 Tax=Leptolyngbya sp. FACHB-261 TaxID=2692806 RepID=UPI001683B836|nr:hypothetical protein [Leptolyngbya sp. FACHB-261]MBD2101335.1 hypothetical protein [Leptolyngbya sp. FACHB-261]
MNLERIKTLVETFTAAELEAKIQLMESCFVPDEPGPPEVCADLDAVEADIYDYAKALAIRQQIEQQGVPMREALRDLASRMRRFSERTS